MAIKIDNGYILPEMSLKEIKSLTKKIQEDLLIIKRKAQIKIQAKMVAREVDLRSISASNRQDNIVTSVYLNLTNLAKQIQAGDKIPSLDFSCKMIFIASGSNILVQVISERPEYVEYFSQHPELKPYNYNPADGDEKSKARGQAWTSALSEGSPAQVGFTADLIDPHYDLCSLSEIISNMPTIAERAEYTSMVLEENIFKQTTKEINEASFRAFLNSPESRSRVAERRVKHEGLLKEPITREDLI